MQLVNEIIRDAQQQPPPISNTPPPQQPPPGLYDNSQPPIQSQSPMPSHEPRPPTYMPSHQQP